MPTSRKANFKPYYRKNENKMKDPDELTYRFDDDGNVI